MPKKAAVPAASMRVLKIATCPSLSGRSQLTYHLGCNAEGDIQLRVVQNSGSGQFNADWISLSMVKQLLSEHPKEKPLTSSVLHPVFRNKSSNSPSFAFAVLLAESIVLPGPDKDSGYRQGDISVFKQAMLTLLSSDTDLAVPANGPTEISKRKQTGKA